MFSVVNVYLEHLKFCVVCMVKSMSVVVNVMSLMSVMSQLVKLCTLDVFALGRHDILPASRSRSGPFSWKSQIRFIILPEICGGWVKNFNQDYL